MRRLVVVCGALVLAGGCDRLVALLGGGEAPPDTAPAVEIAWFQDDGTGCAWMRGGPGVEPTKLALLGEPCGGSVSFAIRGDEALVLRDRIWHVKLATGEVKDLGAPTPGDMAEVGFDANGAILAYTVGGGTYAHPENMSGPITFDGKEWDTSVVLDGLPALTHGFEWKDGAWQRLETKLVSTGWDYAEDQRGLEAYKRLASMSSHSLWHEHAGDAKDVPTPDTVALNALLPPDVDPQAGEWHAVETPDGQLAWWMEQVEFLVTTQRVYRKPAPPGPAAEAAWMPVSFEGWDRFDSPSVQTRGGYVLFSHWGAKPFLVDVATGTTHWSRPDAIGASLWPPPTP
jgi:hypothetical protein